MFKQYILAGLMSMAAIGSACAQKPVMYNFIAGTYTKGNDSKGVYYVRYDAEGQTSTITFTPQVTDNASWISLSPDNKYIYTVNELGDDSRLTALALDVKEGEMTQINTVSSNGSAPCYIINTTRHVMGANYGSGNVTVYDRLPNGGIGRLLQEIKFEAPAGNTGTSRAHMVALTPDKQYAVIANLGLNALYCYSYNAEGGDNVLNFSDALLESQKSGPRHFAFNKAGSMLYCIHEFTGDVTTVTLAAGKLKQLYTAKTTVPGFTGKADGGEIAVSDDDRFVYASTRGDMNKIHVFNAAVSGKLTKVQDVDCGGIAPRSFALSNDGQYLFVANQRSNSIAVFKRSVIDGKLTDTKVRISLPAPVSVTMLHSAIK